MEYKRRRRRILFFLLLINNWCFGQSVIINEINYNNIAVGEQVEFIELRNTTGSTKSISNWFIENAVDFQFPTGASIPANGYVIIAQNISELNSNFSIPAGVNVYGPFTGKLSNEGEEVILRDNAFNQIDKVSYKSWDEWPSIRHTPGSISIQKLSPSLTGNYAGSWSSASPSPGSGNAVSISSPASYPIITKVAKVPDAPTAGIPVTIRAEFQNISAGAGVSVSLEYQTMNAGSYIAKSDAAYASNWTSVSMLDNGAGQDAIAGDGIYTYQLPASIQVNRRLVRYRVRVQNNAGVNKLYPDQNHQESNYAYYVYNGVSDFNGYSASSMDPLQTLQLLTKNTDVNSYVLAYTGTAYPGQGTLVYEGRVYDHIGFRSRGKRSRHNRAKRSLKFDMNSAHSFVPKDDYGKEVGPKLGKIALSGTWVNDANSHGLTESLIYKVSSLVGGLNKSANYVHLRIVDSSTESGINGDFYGIYLFLDDWGGDLLEKLNQPDGNIYSYKSFEMNHAGENGPYGINNSAYTNWNNAWGNSQNGCSSCAVPTPPLSFINSKLDKEHHYADIILNEYLSNGETNYPGQHSYREFHNPITDQWNAQCGDYDEVFGVAHSNKTVYPRSATTTNDVVRHPLKIPLETYSSLKIEIDAALRSAYDLLFNTQQKDFLVDSEARKIFKQVNGVNWTDWDKAKWAGVSDNHGNTMSYTNYKTDVVDWYKNYFNGRAAQVLSNIADSNIPNKPTISYSGAGSYPINQLTFQSSSYSDPNGNAIQAMQWRIGEWSNPANNVYSQNKEAIYEIEDVLLAELSNFNSSYTFQSQELNIGHTYKARVRHQDNTGRWSHWSDPITFVAGSPVGLPNYDLVINEIHYNPLNSCAEFVEIYNNGSNTVSLNYVEFTKGVNYNFPQETTIASGGFIVLARDSVCFVNTYGFSPFGDYKDKLDNGGEHLRLKGPYDIVIDSVNYDDVSPWVTDPDGLGPSLALKSPSFNNLVAGNWGVQSVPFTPGAANVFCTPIIINGFEFDITCLGGNDGFLQASASGGASPYQFDWSNGTSGTSISNLTAGNYTVTVTDANECTETGTWTLTQPASAVNVSVSKQNQTQYNVNNGSATASGSGGTPDYSYSWSTGSSSATINNLAPGNYTITVTDDNDCTDTQSVTINPVNCVVNANVTHDDLSYFDANDGSATASGSGGPTPYFFSWSNGSLSATINNLSPGNYTVTVTASNGCFDTQTVTIDNVPCSFTASATHTDLSYFDANDGSATASGSGEPEPFSFNWSNGSTAATINNLSPGTYTVTVTSSNNCSDTQTLVIDNVPCSFTASATHTDLSYFDANDGSATASGSGEPEPFSFNWSNGSTTATINNLSPGSYTVTVTSSNNCSDTQTLVIDNVPCSFTASATHTDLSYFDANDGSATASGSGEPEPYSFNWSNGSTTATINNLSPGSYTVTVTSSNNCSDTQTLVIDNVPCSFTASATHTDLSYFDANDGSATASGSGEPEPYSFNWLNGSTTATINNLSPGTYTVTVTSSNNCSDTQALVIDNVPCSFIASATHTDVTYLGSNNGTATASGSGEPTPYSFAWSNGANTATINNLSPGSYTVTVTSSNNCSDTHTLVIDEVSCALISNTTHTDITFFGSNNGTATASATDGPTPYSFVWSNGANTASISNLAPGNYNVTVTAANGCFDVSSLTIDEVNCSSFSLNLTKTDETYLNNDDGSATANPVGIAPFSYTWSNNASSKTISNLSPGTYTVTVVDAVGCSDIKSITIDAIVCDNFNLSTTSTNVSYVDADDGTATANPTGTAPFTYVWSNGASSKTINNLAPSSYTVSVVDAVGCSSISTVNIGDINCVGLTLNVNVTDESAFNANDGAATASASGANPGYSFEWSTGASGASISNLTAGNYSVTVTDNLGCTDEKLFSVSPGNTGIIYGKIYLDGNNNSSLDANEAGIANVDVIITQSDGTITTLNTNINGDWSAVVLTGLTQVDILDSDPQLNGFTKTEGADQELITVTIGSQTNTGLDGFFIPCIVCGHLYMDANDSGTHNAGEDDLANVNVLITDVSGSTQTIATNANGDYCADVYEGAVTINIQNSDPQYPTGFNISQGADPTSMNAEPAITKYATPVGFSLCPVLNAGSNKTICFTEQTNLGSVNTIANGSGNYSISWAPVASLDDPNSLNPIASPTVTTTYTLTVIDQASGCTLTDQITINVTQAQIPDAGNQKIIECGDAVVIGANPIANNGTPYTWSNGASGTVKLNGANIDFGQISVSPDETSMYYLSITDNGCTTVDSVLVIVECEGDLCGDLFIDTDGDGIQDANENDLANVDVIITDAAGIVYTVTTDANGQYCATVINGTTTIEIDQNDPQFPDGGVVSVGNDPNTVTVLTSQTVNAGTVGIFIPADLYGNVYNDANGNGQRDSAEDGFNNIDIIITDAQANTQTVSTNSNGDWNAQVMPGSTTIDLKDADLAYDASSTEGNDPTTINAVANNNNHAGDDGFILLCANITMNTTLNNHVSCNDGNDGSANAIATGGKAPYNYQWSDGGTGATRNNLTAAFYTITVTDDNACTSVNNISISEPPVLTATVTKTNETYNDADDGTANLNVIGGTPAYSYLWSNGANSSSITGLAPSNYTVTITDSKACIINQSVSIAPVNCLNISMTSSHTDITYNGLNNGTASVNPSGGQSPYSFSWSNGASGSSINDLAEGDYTVTVLDNIGCQLIETITIDPFDCTSLDLNVTSTDLSLLGANDGTADAAVSGGTTPYAYAWNTGQISSSLTGLGPGTYTVTITDSLGCQSIGSTVINNVDCSSLNITINTSDESQYQANDGTATAIPAGGQAPYSYNWSTGESSQSISNLSPGNYTATLTDNNACSTIKNFNILQAQTGYLTGRVYEDKNNSGSFDGNDSGIANVDIKITESDGSTLTVTTNASGNWITIVRPGLNLVEIFDSNGLLAGADQSEGDNPSTITSILGQTTNAGDDGFNFFTELCGMLYYDTNANGVNDANEKRLSNLELLITDQIGAVHSIFTDDNGAYCIEIIPGNASIYVNENNSNFPSGANVTQNTNPQSINIFAGNNQATDMGFFRTLDLDIEVFLEGALAVGSGEATFGDEMRTELNEIQVLPGQTYFGGLFGDVYFPPGQPYNQAPWFYNGFEGASFDSGGNANQGDAGYPADVVDWVLVSLRTGLNKSDEVCNAAALLLKNGKILLTSDFDCDHLENEYYLVIEHRNHLIIMSSDKISISNGVLTYDFTIKQSYTDAFGLSSGQKLVVTENGENKYVMISGNADQTSTVAADTDVNVNDKIVWEAYNNDFPVYISGDFDLSGDTNVNDKLLWEGNNNNFSSVPR